MISLIFRKLEWISLEVLQQEELNEKLRRVMELVGILCYGRRNRFDGLLLVNITPSFIFSREAMLITKMQVY